MKAGIQYSGLLLAVLISMSFVSCKQEKSQDTETIQSDTIKSHGYNELANPDNRETFTISDFNSDNPEVDNIDRPSASTIKTDLDTKLLFDMWTSDPEGPHADFDFTAKSFFVVDYDGDGAMPYELINDDLKIYYNDFIQQGKIISVDRDTLKINWKDFENTSKYVRWRS